MAIVHLCKNICTSNAHVNVTETSKFLYADNELYVTYNNIKIYKRVPLYVIQMK